MNILAKLVQRNESHVSGVEMNHPSFIYQIFAICNYLFISSGYFLDVIWF